MDTEVSFIKTIMNYISIPLTFILGLVGFHWKSFYKKVDTLKKTTDELTVSIAEHNIHLQYINENIDAMNYKLDYIMRRFDEESPKPKRRSHKVQARAV